MVIYFTLFAIEALAQKKLEEKYAALDSGGLEIGYEAYVDFHYVTDFNHSVDNFRPFNSSPINVNQFAVGYTYAQATFEYRRMTARAALSDHKHTQWISDERGHIDGRVFAGTAGNHAPRGAQFTGNGPNL